MTAHAWPPGRTRAARTRPGGRPPRRSRVAWWYTAPTLLVVALVTIFPIGFSVVMSFSRVELSSSGFSFTDWSTDNYAAVLQSPVWREALVFTVLYTLVSVAVELVLGVLVALVLERLTAARGWLMALLLIPWAMITVISAQLWSYIFNSAYGAASWLLGLFTDEPPVILGTPASAFSAILVADVWKTTPFVAIIVLAGLVTIDRSVYEAAEMDGSGPWSTFWRITLPLLRTTLAIAVLFRVLQAFGIFDLPFVLTSGGPGTSTQPLALLGWRVMFQNLNMGAGAAVAASTALIVFLACLLCLRAFRAQVGEEEVR
ncbi:carbohydrate ABC transporter permease [Streptomyces litchfieldiae]|uniref:Sugar ABC transporter permease n=1 Tax=Streptomyces litchfieldiae TaxID=3075543 RepID=A0ABU2MS31_9ACTN|nr:sugar ABC transporter permease [Streptomyces sp. DSM 44938]MDT0344436.1 sugar ABC transporter permease [Streptomyces sp. DSM 44938]